MTGHIGRRGGKAPGWPPAARAQHAASTVRRMGLLLPGHARTTAPRGQLHAFRQGLNEYGWVEAKKLIMKSRFAERREDARPTNAAELARLRCHRGGKHGGNPGGKNCYANRPNRHGDERRSGWNWLGREPQPARRGHNRIESPDSRTEGQAAPTPDPDWSRAPHGGGFCESVKSGASPN